jgi:hypothetical protein
MIGFNKIVIVRPNAEVSIINQNLGWYSNWIWHSNYSSSYGYYY